MAFTAIYDACVLYPAPLRDILVQLARTGLFHARWTDRIHEEWISNLLINRPDLNEAALRLTISAMDRAIRDCLISGYEGLIPAVDLPDPNDRHVLAAAVHGRVDVIVTFNLKDFPAAALAAHNIEAQHPDVFIRHALDLDTDAIEAVRTCRQRLKNPPKSVEEYLATLLQQGLPETVSFLRDWTSVL